MHKRDDVIEALRIRSAASTGLMTGTAAVGAAGFALAAFAAGLHVVRTSAVLLWVAGGVGLFLSALAGGLAIGRLSERGSSGDWALSNSKPWLGIQIWALGIGTALLAAGSVIAFSGPAKLSDEARQDREIGRLSAELSALQQSHQMLVKELAGAEIRLNSSARHSGRRP